MTEASSAIRVVIPAYHAEKTIVQCIQSVLTALSSFSTYEIIIVDNGGNANLKILTAHFPVSILERIETTSAAYARNEGAKDFLQGYLIFIDSDVVCEKQCIIELIAPLQKGEAQASVGNYSTNIRGLTFTQTYKQLYINFVYSSNGPFIKNDFWTAIGCIDAGIFHQLGGFENEFKGARGEDQELGIRLFKKGYTIAFAQKAIGQHLHIYGIMKIIKNDFKKGINIIKNTAANKVPLTDNRHSKKRDMLSVIFSILTLVSLPLNVIHPVFMFISLLCIILWITCRSKLLKTYLHYGNSLFVIRAILLMHCLDIVRFTCAMIGLIQYKYLGIKLIKSLI